MTKTFALQHPCEPEHNPHTIGTLAASLVACTHAEQDHVRAPGGPGASDAFWCAACGALRFGHGPAARWKLAALPSLATREQFEDLVLLLHGVRQLTLLARSQACAGATGSREHAVFRSVRTSLLALARLPIVQGLDRLEAALADMPASFHATQGGSR